MSVVHRHFLRTSSSSSPQPWLTATLISIHLLLEFRSEFLVSLLELFFELERHHQPSPPVCQFPEPHSITQHIIHKEWPRNPNDWSPTITTTGDAGRTKVDTWRAVTDWILLLFTDISFRFVWLVGSIVREIDDESYGGRERGGETLFCCVMFLA